MVEKWQKAKVVSFFSEQTLVRFVQPGKTRQSVMIIYFILIFFICSLFLSLRKGYRPHPRYIYEMIMEMDSFAQDPKNHVPVLMVPKATTNKNETTPNLEVNLLSLPPLKIQPNQELLTPEIKIEPEDIVQIDY